MVIALTVLLAAAFQGASRDDSVTVAAPPTSGESPWYVGHRAPLAPEPLLKLPVGTVRARGWLARQIDLAASEMFGRLPELSHWCRPEKSAWRSKDGRGENGWEELPYWLKGFTSLAILVDGGDESDGTDGAASADPKLRALAVEWLEAILASQRDDGWFGPESNHAQPDLWPNMPVLWAMRTWHESTGDARILDFLKKYFRYELALPREKLLPDSWQKVRGGDNLDVVHWLYDRTGEPWLLELAQRLHERTADWTAGIASWHGVNFCQGFREPFQFFVQSHEIRHRDAMYLNYAEMMAKFGQVAGGMFGADENCRVGYRDPRQAAEACSMVEFMSSFELLGAQTGETVWFDRCEDVAFNSLPAAMDENLRSLHYLTAPNMVVCDAKDHSPGVENGGCMLAFSPDERYRCCQHNVVQGWPYFVEHLWFATRDRGLAAALLAPCKLVAKAGDGEGADVRIEVETNYPFEESLRIRVQPSRSTRFPVYLRVPAWCAAPRLSIDGEDEPMDAAAGRFVRIEREWEPEGHEIQVTLPMAVRLRWGKLSPGLPVDRGPLTYSLDIAEEWSVDEAAPNEWPTTELHPASPWNYGLELGPVEIPFDLVKQAAAFRYVPATPQDVKLKTGEVALLDWEPFEHRHAPRLLTKGRRIPAWQLDWTGLVAPLQSGLVKSDELVEEITLIPMGCARLRISEFPLIDHDPHSRAPEWKAPSVPPKASHVHDDPFALNDGVVPKRSIDHTVPRFTFWDHLGTVEWVQYDFAQPRRVARSAVYWFDDTGKGRCRVPKSWRLLWLDDDGAGADAKWREVELAGASGYGVVPNRINDVTFTPVTTKSLRLEVTLQPEFSGGLFEWTVGE